MAAKVVKAIGAEKTAIRLSPYGAFNGLQAFEGLEAFYTHLAGELGKLKLAYVHIVDHAAMGAPEVTLSVKTRIRDAFGGVIIVSGGLDKAKAETAISSGLGELAAFGRPFLANPDLVLRMEKDLPLNEPDYSTFYTPGEKGYTDYPTVGEAKASS